MKFSSSIFFAAAPCLFANSALGAALPPVTDGLNVDPATLVDPSLLDPTTVVNQVRELVGGALPDTTTITDDLASHLAFLTLDLPTQPGLDLPTKRDLPATEGLGLVQTAQVILEGAGVTEGWNIAIDSIAQSIIETATDATAIDTTLPTIPTPEKRHADAHEGLNSEEAIKFFLHVAGVIPTGTLPENLFLIVTPVGVTLREYLGLPSILGLDVVKTTAEKRHDDEHRNGGSHEIQIIRIVNGQIVRLDLSIRVLGITLVRAWNLSVGL
ncbi:hypothetical protein QBC44DRAFT_384258 [Cladorrhinum sp. PSN332]|nr:hypothetical protein QBC44DRAFT_384258 [Cladorrhinum sp. PSN332]